MLKKKKVENKKVKVKAVAFLFFTLGIEHKCEGSLNARLLLQTHFRFLSNTHMHTMLSVFTNSCFFFITAPSMTNIVPANLSANIVRRQMSSNRKGSIGSTSPVKPPSSQKVSHQSGSQSPFHKKLDVCALLFQH